MSTETIRVSGPEISPVIAPAELAEAMLSAGCSHSIATRGTERILLVEDEAFVRTVTAEVLESAGYRVRIAANAAEAFKNFEMQRQYSDFVDLLLADVVLPGKSGYDISKEFAASCPGGKVLLMSGCAGHLAWCDRTTVDHAYLAKPFSAEMLLQKVRATLDRNLFA